MSDLDLLRVSLSLDELRRLAARAVEAGAQPAVVELLRDKASRMRMQANHTSDPHWRKRREQEADTLLRAAQKARESGA